MYTGEHGFGTGSDAVRLLSLRLDKPIDSEQLTECQREPLMLSTFFDYFIQWYVTDYERVCGLLQEWVAKYRSGEFTIHPRLAETQFCFEAAYKLFLTYCTDREFITADVALGKYNAFYNHLSGAIKEQDARANSGGFQFGDERQRVFVNRR
jgi:hypothetical protein